MSLFRRRKEVPAPQADYERARKNYRRSLNSLVSSVLATFLVLTMVTPMLGMALIGNSQVYTGPVDGKFGSPMLPLMAYGVDLNYKASTPVSQSFNDLASKDAAPQGLLESLLGTKKTPSGISESRTGLADATYWSAPVAQTPNPAVKVYLLPDFIILGQGGGIYKEGDFPIYVPVKDIISGGKSLNDVTSIATPSSNGLSGLPSNALPFHIVISKDQATANTKAITGDTSGTQASTLDFGKSEMLSPVYNSDEAYVYFSPKSVMEQYTALSAEYATRKTDLESRADKGDVQAKLQSGMYLATMKVLQCYLNETLPQDGSRGWAGFNTARWTGSVLDGATGGDLVNNTLLAADPSTGNELTFAQLRDLSTPYHPGGTDDGAFTPPYYPIQFHLMNAGESTYRFQVLETMNLKTGSGPGGQGTGFEPNSGSSVNLGAALKDIGANFTGGSSSGQTAIDHTQQNADDDNDAVLISRMIPYVPGGYATTKAQFYAPLTDNLTGDLYMSRISPARTPAVSGLAFIGYTPAAAVAPDKWAQGSSTAGYGSGIARDPGGGGPAKNSLNSMNPQNAMGSLYLAWPSFAPSISSHMATGKAFNTLNLELSGLVTPGATFSDGVKNFFKKLTVGLLGGPIAMAAQCMSEWSGTTIPNHIGWAYSDDYTTADQSVSPSGAGNSTTGATDDVPNIEGGRPYTGKKSVYTGKMTIQRQAMVSNLGATPLGGMAGALHNDVSTQMAQQAYKVDSVLAELGDTLNFANPDFVIGGIIAGGADWLLRGGVQLFKFAFATSGNSSGSQAGDLNAFANWKDPFEILLSTPGLGGIYTTLQSFALLFVALFTFWWGISLVISPTKEEDDGVWPINFGVSQAKMKTALPRIVVAVLMIGVPAAATGGKIVPGLNYFIATFIVRINDAICSILGVSATTQFMQNLTNISSMAGQSIISALVFALIAFVMFIAFLLGAMMLLLRTLFLYLFILCGPLVWAFWALEGKGSSAGKFNFSSLDGDLPRRWLKGITSLAFVQLFWVFCFFIISALFTSPELTANIFGVHSATAASVGMATAHAAVTIPVVTGLANSMDLIIRLIIVVIAFGIMIKIGMSAFKDTAVSGIGAVNSAGKALTGALKSRIPGSGVKERASNIQKAVERGDMAGARKAVSEARTASVAQVGKVAGKANAVASLATKEGRAAALKSATESTADRAKSVQRAIANDKDALARESGGKTREDLLRENVKVGRDGLVNDKDRTAFAKAMGEGLKQAKGKYSEEDWKALGEVGQRRAALAEARDTLATKDGAMDAHGIDQVLGVNSAMSTEEMVSKGLQADRSFVGTEADRRSVAASLLTQQAMDGVIPEEALQVGTHATRMASEAAALTGAAQAVLSAEGAVANSEATRQRATKVAEEIYRAAAERAGSDADALAAAKKSYDNELESVKSDYDRNLKMAYKSLADAQVAQKEVLERHSAEMLASAIGVGTSLRAAASVGAIGSAELNTLRHAVATSQVTEAAELALKQRMPGLAASGLSAADVAKVTGALAGCGGSPDRIREQGSILAKGFTGEASREVERVLGQVADAAVQARVTATERSEKLSVDDVANYVEAAVKAGRDTLGLVVAQAAQDVVKDIQTLPGTSPRRAAAGPATGTAPAVGGTSNDALPGASG